MMSTTQGPTEPASGTPPGAIPQPPPPSPDPAEDPFRSGDTAVVFRLERDVPFVHRLHVLATSAGEQLLENWRMVLAGGVALVAVVALAVMVGGAYWHRPAPAPAARAAALPPPAPHVAQPAAAVAPVVVPLPAVASPTEQAPPGPAARPVRVRARPAHARGASLPAQKNFKATPPLVHR